jgi:hypothetical protein
MKIKSSLGMVLLLAGAALADDASSRAKLLGTWRPEGDIGAGGSAWSFSSQGDSLEITEIEGGNKVAVFKCGTDGKSCEVKVSGKKATVSFWYNGPKLVELEAQGSGVVERRFVPSDDSMEVEVVPMVPSGKAETTKFKRSPLASAK